MHFNGFFLVTILYLSLLWSFITDFFHDSSWVSRAVQYGPMALAWFIIMVVGIYEAVNTHGNDDAAGSKSENGSKFLGVFALFYMWFAIAAMNFLAGEPRMDLINVYSPEFWIFLILIPLLGLFNYRRKTDRVV